MGCSVSTKRRCIEQEPDANQVEKADQLQVLAGCFIQENSKKFEEVYRIAHVVSKGVFGEIRTCFHRETGRKRAVKVYRKEKITSEVLRCQVEREIQIMKAIDHPNVVRIFEFFEDWKRLYVVLEFCRGTELHQEILKKKGFTEPKASQAMKHIFSALAYMHAKGIMHRNVCPGSVLVESWRDCFNVKFIDLSLACKVTEGTSEEIFEVVNDPAYLAPEVLSKDYDEKCDIWSAGVVMYSLLCGVFPSEVTPDSVKGLAVSEEAKELLSKLICPLSERYSAEEALGHKWILQNSFQSNSSNQEVINTLQNLQNFKVDNKLKDAVYTFIATQCMSAPELRKAREVFRAIDSKGDGKLDFEELERSFKLVDPEAASGLANQVLGKLDADCSGFIDYTEFLKGSFNVGTVLSEENLNEAFKVFDRDGSGSISSEELQKILQGDNKCNQQVWEEFIQLVDQNGDGEIDLKEFQHIVLSQM